MTNWTPLIAEAAGPRYLAIAEALAADIAEGRLKPGDRLPTHRDLAWHLGVTVGTVSRAYAEAERRGLTSGEVGRGTFVNSTSGSEQLTRLNAGPPGTIQMRSAYPIPCAEEALIGEAMAHVAAGPKAMALLAYQPQPGRPEHRQAGAEWMGQNGFEVPAERVILTAGAHHGVMVVLAAVTRSGDHIVADCLTYPGIRSLARLMGLRLDGLARDSDGPLPQAFEDACRVHDVKAIYLCPTLHNPTSISMSQERRRALAEVARRHDVAIVEDDVFGFLTGSLKTPISAYAPERSYYVCGVAKTLAPGLRIGYIVAPPDMEGHLSLAIQNTSWMACPLTAEVCTDLIQSGAAATVAAGRIRAAGERRRLALEILGDWDCDCEEHANFLWLHLPDPWRSNEFTAEAERRGVLLTASDPFMLGRRESSHAVRICLGPPRDNDELFKALMIVAALLREGPSYTFGNVV